MPRHAPRVCLLAFALAAAAFPAEPGALKIDYPLPGALFPPEFPSPTILWRDPTPAAAAWTAHLAFLNGAPARTIALAGTPMTPGEIDPRAVGPTNELPRLTPEQAASRAWKPDAATWAAIKENGGATLVITGHVARGAEALSRGEVTIRISADRVGAPIFYRDVPLMPSETEKGVIKPLAAAAVPLIAWRLRDLGSARSRVVMEGVHSCANCHSASADGKTMGMDIDGPQNDKGLYALFSIQPQATIRAQDVIAWSSHRGKLGGKLRVGFMSQVSPDGRYVVTTIAEPREDQSDYQRRRQPKDLAENYYVANFRDYRFLQVFYPTRGILAWHNRETGALQPLPGADDPRYVHTNAVWTPDGRYLIFARAEARNPYPPGASPAEFANDPNETQIRYDLYRVPFNGGKGGIAEPIAGASHNGRSNSFPKVSPDGKWIVFVQARNGQLMRPDSELYIVPAAGGTARRMNCNTPLMNSWHSWAPNGRWMVFSSKSRSPYTQMFLTHVDENGVDTPAILVENATASNRAVNLPEFLNIPYDGLLRIDAPVTKLYESIDRATELANTGDYAAAVEEWSRAAELGPSEAMVRFNLANALSRTPRIADSIAEYEKALELSPDHAEAHNNLGFALVSLGRVDDAIPHFEKALESNPENSNARLNLGNALAQRGRVSDAVPHLEAAAASRPDDPQAHTSLALALAMTGNLARAEEQVTKAAGLAPRSIEIEVLLGRVLASQSKFAAAIPHFQTAVELTASKDAGVLDLLAGCYAETGRMADAVATARHALAVASGQANEEFIRALKARVAAYEAALTAQ